MKKISGGTIAAANMTAEQRRARASKAGAAAWAKLSPDERSARTRANAAVREAKRRAIREERDELRRKLG